MPVLSCPLGVRCTDGPEQSMWKTENVALEAALKLQENHVKYAHQEAAAGAAPATLKAEKLVRPRLGTERSRMRNGSTSCTGGTPTRPRPTSLSPPRATWSPVSIPKLR